MNRPPARPYGAPPKTPRLPPIADRAGWFKLLDLAAACAEDADRGEVEGPALQRRMDLSHLIHRAEAVPFRRAGAATEDWARAFIRACRAFARAETPQSLRGSMAHGIADMARFLDERLHAVATDDFQNFHQGRSEIVG